MKKLNTCSHLPSVRPAALLLAALALLLAMSAIPTMAQEEPQEPPAAPRNLTAAVHGDGSVTLSWEAPDDDSVSGYQILRRRPYEGEKTLLVYVADTGSTATTFTDADVTAGTQHVYRVKAINAAGPGAQSNYVNVDVPYTGTDDDASSGEPRQARDDHEDGYYLDCPVTEVNEGESVDVFLVLVPPSSPTSSNGALWLTEAGTAGAADYRHQETSDIVWGPVGSSRVKRTVETREDYLVEGNETFTFGFVPTGDVFDPDDPERDEKCDLTIIDDDDPGTVPPRPPAPPPGRIATLVSNQDQSNDETWSLDDARAVGFTTGPARAGYEMTAAKLVFASPTATPQHLSVQLWSSIAASAPGSLLATLTNPYNLSNGGLKTFSAPVGTTLLPNTTYFIYVHYSAQSNVPKVRITDSDSEKSSSLSGWSVFDHSYTSQNGWKASSPRFPTIKMEVRGSVIDPESATLVSNHGQRHDATWAPRAPLAVGFTTGPAADGYNMTAAQLVFSSGTSTPTTLFVQLWSANGSAPGSLIAALTKPDNLSNGGVKTFSAPAHTTLDANTTYFIWAYYGSTSNVPHMRTTDSDDEDATSLSGWSIADQSYINVLGWQASDNTIKVAVAASIITVPHEPTGLSAAAHGNALRVTWSVPISDGGLPIAGYSVQYRLDGDDTLPWTDAAHTGTGVSAVIDGLTDGTYDVRVAAVNSAGTGNYVEGSVLKLPTLVSNHGQRHDATWALRAPLAVGFTTGPAADGYNMTAAHLVFSRGTSTPATLLVQLWSANGSAPGSLIAALTKPDNLSDGGVKTFSAPAHTTLDANTTYFIWAYYGPTSNVPHMRTTDSDDEDATSLSGWSIADQSYINVNVLGWQASDNTIKVAVAASVVPYDDEGVVWSGIMTVGAISGNDRDGYAADPPAGSLDVTTFVYGDANRTIDNIYRTSLTSTGSQLVFSLADAGLGDVSDLALQVGSKSFDFSDASFHANQIEYSWSTSNDVWSVGDTVVLRLVTNVAPGAPTGLGATPGDGQVTLTWTAPASTGGADISGYEYEQNGSGTWVSTGATATSHTVTGLTNGQAYTFRVRAVNSVGPGTASALSASVTPAVPPVEPPHGFPRACSATPDMSDTTAPSLTGAQVDGETVTLEFDEAICGGAGSALLRTHFQATVNGSAWRVNKIAYDDSTVRLTLERAVTAIDAVSIRYSPDSFKSTLLEPLDDIEKLNDLNHNLVTDLRLRTANDSLNNVTPGTVTPPPGGGGGGGNVGGGGSGGGGGGSGGGGGGSGGGGGGSGGGGGGSGGGGGGGPAAVVEIDGASYTAADTETVFTVAISDGTRIRALRWTVTGPDGFTATSDAQRFAFVAPADGTYTVSVTVGDIARRTLTGSATLTVLGDITDHRFVNEIIWLAEQGISRGCAAHTYCPNNPVTRAQMASFLTRALDLQAPPRQAGFVDVDPTNVHATNIEALHRAQITAGCTQEPLQYCPNRPITRAQMAAFLYRARHLITAAGTSTPN